MKTRQSPMDFKIAIMSVLVLGSIIAGVQTFIVIDSYVTHTSVIEHHLNKPLSLSQS